jgi:hypothetical protein
VNGYIILALKWAITLILAYAIYTTTHNAYIPISLIYVMIWQEVYASLLGRIIGVQDTHTLCIETLFLEKAGKYKEQLNKIIEQMEDDKE